MSPKAPTPPRFPEKEIPFKHGRRDDRDGERVVFRRLRSQLGQFDDQSGIYVYNKFREPGTPASQQNPLSFQKYPSVYSVQLSGGYTFDWDVLADEYFENRGWINYEQLSLYGYVKSLRNRGYHVSVRPRPGRKVLGLDGEPTGERDEVRGLAQITGRSCRYIERDLDVLEDCLLIHRVRRPDFSGAPNEFVVHSPFTVKDLQTEIGSVIEQRVAEGATRSRREGIAKRGVGKDGRPFVYHNRRADSPTFVYDARETVKAFGDKTEAFIYWAMSYFQNEWDWLWKRKGEWQKQFREVLFAELNRWGINGDEARHACYREANKFRTIYCPLLEEELCAG
jgi:hypothetical protein